MSLIEVARFPDRIAAELARGRLAADGIDSVPFDEGLAALGFQVLGSVRLMVLEEDRIAAAAILDAPAA